MAVLLLLPWLTCPHMHTAAWGCGCAGSTGAELTPFCRLPHPHAPPEAGDWLQGPYIYALYEHYGYQVGDIGRLFIAGFASSMVFGTLAGALADQ